MQPTSFLTVLESFNQGESKMSTHIECRRWREKTYGNTYFSARINNEMVIPFAYGYGEQCLYEAAWLLGYKDGLLRGFLDSIGATYSIIDVARKKDL